MDITLNDILLGTTLNVKDLPTSITSSDICCIRNCQFAQTYDEKIYQYRAIPSKHLIVICCIDGRLDIYRMLGLQPGQAFIIRNGGGRVRDAIRSLIYSQTLFEIKEIMIIHHTDCGFTYFTNNDQILSSLIVRTGRRTNESLVFKPFYQNEKTDFMPILDIEQSIRDDLTEYRQHSMLDQSIIVRGFLYNTKTGLLKEIEIL